MKAGIIGLLAMLLAVTMVSADIPQVMGYQGRITDNTGNAVVDGDYTMKFRIYDNAGGSGDPIWDSGDRTVAVTGGVFSVMLGESPQPALGLSFEQDYWLLVTFDGEDQTPPRRFGSVGYAYMASGLVPGTEVSGELTSVPVLKATNTSTAGSGQGFYGATDAPDGAAVLGWADATTGTNYGVWGASQSPYGAGVGGLAFGPWGVTCGGTFESQSTDGIGVQGLASATIGNATGVRGECASWAGSGVHGHASATIGAGYGVFGSSDSPDGLGVCGWAYSTTGESYGVYGHTSSSMAYCAGVYGEATSSIGWSHGGWFKTSSAVGIGVEGEATATTDINYGVYGKSASSNGTGVCGWASSGSGQNYGVYGHTNSTDVGWGGYFHGDVFVNGTVFKTEACNFLMDHPLDPENKLLRYACVESPEYLLIYRGRVQLNGMGQAVVDLPDHFGALSDEEGASIQLTAAGKPFLTGADWDAGFQSFTVYGEPDCSVFWEVLAERDDPVIRQEGQPVEMEKGPDSKFCDRGELLCPAPYGYPEAMRRGYELAESERIRTEGQVGRTHGGSPRPRGQHRNAPEHPRLAEISTIAGQ